MPVEQSWLGDRTVAAAEQLLLVFVNEVEYDSFSRNGSVERDVRPGKKFQPRSAKPTCVELDRGDEGWKSKVWRRAHNVCHRTETEVRKGGDVAQGECRKIT
jgi:hypothetical protein